MFRQLFVVTFVVLAAIFVPVRLSFGLVEYIVPVAWIAFAAVRAGLAQSGSGASLWSFGYLVVYLLLFCGAARLIFAFSSGVKSPTARWIIQGVALLTLFSCSFLRVITYSSIQGKGGTYTFWGAASRYAEQQRLR